LVLIVRKPVFFRPNAIGVIAAEVGDPYGQLIISGIERYLRANGFFLLDGGSPPPQRASRKLFAIVAGTRRRRVYHVPLASYSNPTLTTVRQPLQKMGEIAARTLLDRIEYRSEYVAEIAIETELIVRESTAPAPNAI
jgi:DNA-binding LacI/PurR family transcriptional regulator